MGFLSRWLASFSAERSLAGVTKPTRVRVRCTVAGADSVASPMTERRGALVEWGFWDRRLAPSVEGPDGRVAHQTRVATGRAPKELLLVSDGRTVLVATDHARFEFIGAWDAGPVPGLLPDALARAHPSLADVRQDLRYDERVLSTGQSVLLVGWVEPAARTADVYRGRAPSHDFLARPDLGELAVLELPGG